MKIKYSDYKSIVYEFIGAIIRQAVDDAKYLDVVKTFKTKSNETIHKNKIRNKYDALDFLFTDRLDKFLILWHIDGVKASYIKRKAKEILGVT